MFIANIHELNSDIIFKQVLASWSLLWFYTPKIPAAMCSSKLTWQQAKLQLLIRSPNVLTTSMPNTLKYMFLNITLCLIYVYMSEPVMELMSWSLYNRTILNEHRTVCLINHECSRTKLSTLIADNVDLCPMIRLLSLDIVNNMLIF